jgi:hypothetical protein
MKKLAAILLIAALALMLTACGGNDAADPVIDGDADDIGIADDADTPDIVNDDDNHDDDGAVDISGGGSVHYSTAILGTWQTEDENGIMVIGFNADGTYVMGLSAGEGHDVIWGDPAEYRITRNLLILDGDSRDYFLDGNTLMFTDINAADQHVVFERQ